MHEKHDWHSYSSNLLGFVHSIECFMSTCFREIENEN